MTRRGFLGRFFALASVAKGVEAADSTTVMVTGKDEDHAMLMDAIDDHIARCMRRDLDFLA